MQDITETQCKRSGYSKACNQYRVVPPRAFTTASILFGRLLYKALICSGLIAAKASCKELQRDSLPENTQSRSSCATIGHKCSMGFMSGDCGGQTPPLNLRILYLFKKATVDNAVCGGAPSCWKVYRVALHKAQNVATLWIMSIQMPVPFKEGNIPPTNKRDRGRQDVLILLGLHLLRAAAQADGARRIHGCPHHDLLWVSHREVRILWGELIGISGNPPPHLGTRTHSEDLFV